MNQSAHAKNLTVEDFVAALQIRTVPASKPMAQRHHFQWERKLFHVASGLLVLSIYAFTNISRAWSIALLLTALGIALTTEFVRHRLPAVNRWVCRWCHCLMRDHERHRLSSATWYLIGMSTLVALFPRSVGIMTLWFMACGDTAAGIVGSRWGRIRLTTHCSLEGLSAGFLACAVGAWLIAGWCLPDFQLHGAALWKFSLLAGLIGALAEGCVKWKHLDDNVAIPLISAPLLWSAMYWFTF